jgi:hypothetical protein
MSQEARDEARRRAEILMAYADGAEIQGQRIYPVTGWYAQPEPEWDWDNVYYRIKPEPREFLIYKRVNFTGDFVAHAADDLPTDTMKGSIIRVREILP